MIRFLLIVIAVLTAGTGIFFLIAKHQKKRADKAEAEVKALHEAFWQVKEKAERLQQALRKQTEAEAKANEERTELARTPDADLAGRANSLFMQDNRNGKPAGNAGPVKAAGAGSAGNGAGAV
jgi:type II secretory pathway pseudopilin PulG